MINSKLKTYLDRLAGSTSRPSSYIFSGQDENEKTADADALAGKEEAVFYFVSKIANMLGDEEFLEKVKTKNHPDILIIEPEIEEKKGKIREKEINIAQIRDALERLKFFPYELEKKFCVIKKAQKMNAEAANALLKSLEEPSERAIFILTVNEADTILPTIVSRCAVLRFPQIELPKWNEENRKKLREIFAGEVYGKFDFIEKIAKNKNEFIGILKDWELVMAESLRKLATEGWIEPGSRDDRAKIRKVVELLENTHEAINRLERTNASARGVGEELVLNF